MIEQLGKDNRFLDIQNPSFKLSVESLAFLADARVRYTKGDLRPYIALSIRDINGHLVSGWMFNVPNLEEQMVSIIDCKKKPVTIYYKVEPREGRYELKVENVKKYQGAFPFDKFMGSIPHTTQMFDHVQKFLAKNVSADVKMSINLETESFLEICAGRHGGYAKFAYTVFEAIAKYFDSPEVVRAELSLVTLKCLELYANYLRGLANSQVYLPHELLGLISDQKDLGVSPDLQRLNNIITDAGLAVLGIAEPNHPYAHIVKDIMSSTEKLLKITYAYPTMIALSSMRIGDKCIAKY